MARQNPPLAQRIIYPKMKEEIKLEFFRKFTWGERWKILLGFNIRSQVTLQTQHCAGQIKAKCETALTEDVEPKLL